MKSDNRTIGIVMHHHNAELSIGSLWKKIRGRDFKWFCSRTVITIVIWEILHTIILGGIGIAVWKFFWH